jgi:cytochrome c oxidase cbb3-type subunit 4
MISSGVLSGIATAILLVAFIGLCVWAFSPGQKRRWRESAELPFLGDDEARPSAPSPERRIS